MLQPATKVQLHWRTGAPTDLRIRTRLREECEAIAWSLSQMEALLHDAHRTTGLDHPWLLPRIELRVPLYDLERRFRIVLTYIEATRISVFDERGEKVADVELA